MRSAGKANLLADWCPCACASARSSALGSIPGVSTKSVGTVLFDSSYTDSRSNGGGSVNSGPRPCVTNLAPGDTVENRFRSES